MGDLGGLHVGSCGGDKDTDHGEGLPAVRTTVLPTGGGDVVGEGRHEAGDGERDGGDGERAVGTVGTVGTVLRCRCRQAALRHSTPQNRFRPACPIGIGIMVPHCVQAVMAWLPGR